MQLKKALMYPVPGSWGSNDESGIRRVVEAYAQYLPKYGWDVVGDAPHDLVAIHAGTGKEPPDVAHTHGLYWTQDYDAASWEWSANAQVIEGIRGAKAVTVPSTWVQQVFQRDMRFSPTVVPHGIDYWKYEPKYEGKYVLWNKNRNADACDPTPVGALASRCPDVHFVSTFSNAQLKNIRVTGVMPHAEMLEWLRNCSVYFSSVKETFGIGILEAMAMGKPILGFAHGGILDTVSHKVNGYLVEPGNYEELEHGLRYCLEHARELGENSRLLVQRFTWDKAAKIVAEVYDACLVEEPVLCDVVVPVFNKPPEVLARAISSARSQTKYLGRVIVIDDGSRDELSKDYSRICGEMQVLYTKKENGGVATARNMGISMATAKYVACLDADDALADQFLLACVPELEADRSLGIAYTGIWAIDKDGHQGLTQWPGDFDYDKQLQRRNQVPTCCVFRRGMWQRLGGYKQRYAPTGAGAEDAEFWLRAGAYGYGAKKVTDAGLFIYTLAQGHTSQKGYKEVDWTYWHPWTKDGQHPLASVATPKRHSHPVRSYDEPSVSIIIPCGPGHIKHIEDALDSVESQTVRKWEIVLVNDSGEEIPERILRAYPYVKFTETSGGKGAGYARNLGVSKSRGPMILALDVDDMIYPTCLQEMLGAWSRTGYGIYSDYTGVAYITDPKELDHRIQVLNRDEKSGLTTMAYRAAEFDCERAMRQPDPKSPYLFANVSTLIPRRWHDEIGGYDQTMESLEDWDYWIRMVHAGKCFHRVSLPLLLYRFHTGTRREKSMELRQEIVQYMVKKYEVLGMR